MKPAVLVVSRQPGTARDLADALASLDVAVESATAFVQAERLLHHAGYRVVFTETQLEDGTWQDLLRLCDGLEDNPAVVVASIHADARLWVDAIDAGAADVVRLPLERTEALRVIGGVLNQFAAGTAA
ncbi:MAG: hypothetical protein IT160_08460 [Bryobacterales bacterium]|nr:hypothetical protein [Bryobacterales bacterium]